MNLKHIRQKLNEINNGALEQQAQHISELLVNYPHLHCELMKKTPTTDQNFRCFAYALDVHENIEIGTNAEILFQESGSGWRGLADLLEDQKLAWVQSSKYQDGDICFYFDNEISEDTDYDVHQLHELGAKHAGRVVGKYIHSKWGNGHVWKHDFDIVPSDYENKNGEISVLYFRPIATNEEIEKFLLSFYLSKPTSYTFRPKTIRIC